MDHDAKLFFQGTRIFVDRCGNVPGIDPGSTSPVTPYNFIEFHGTGRLKGIAGKKVNLDAVCFMARAEDRNEPGSSDERVGARIDRYFLRAYTCAENTTCNCDPIPGTLLVLEDIPPVNGSVPVAITNGNPQLHISS